MPTLLKDMRQPLFCLAVIALIAGIYARFKGLGGASFDVDEYYLARSIENVLRTGLPAFSCGGFYTRGVVLQYASAAMQLGGSSAEFAPRFLSACSSILCIPAVYILGCRIRGRVVGLLAVILIALSVWEIEMARFGRMYGPFQAVFLWYLVFFLRYTADRNARALWPMIALSILGPLVWEGGVFLPLLNLLSLFLLRWPNSPRSGDWTYLLFCTALLGIALWFVTADFRGYNAESWPPGYVMTLSAGAPDFITTLKLPVTAVRQHVWWLALALIPLLASLRAVRSIWQLRSHRFLAIGLLVMLAAALAHQFLAVGAVGVLLILTRLTTWKDVLGRAYRPIHVAIILCCLFWVVFGLAIVDWHNIADDGLARRASMFIYQFLRFPDLIEVVIRPWASAIPHLGLGLLLLVLAALAGAVINGETSTYERVLLIAFVVLLLAASAGHPPRQETRYVFFLYPVAIIIALNTIARAADLITSRRALAVGITSSIALGSFALSEDFQPHHLLHIDSPAELYRVNMTTAMASHLVIREDDRAIAQWLRQHRSEHDLIINGVHGIDHYYAGINYFFVDEHSSNFPDWSCRHGTIERWGNYSMLYSFDTLTSLVNANTSAYLVAFVYDRDQILHELAALHPEIVMSESDVIVVKLLGDHGLVGKQSAQL